VALTPTISKARALTGGICSQEMCGRFTKTVGPEELGEHFELQIQERTGISRYNIAPTDPVLAIVNRHDRPQARTLRWALVPAGSRTIKTTRPWINAKVETLRSQGSYFGVVPDTAHRVLILADGFYEWPKPEDEKTKRKLKPPPLRFTVDEDCIFCFAGLWTTAPHIQDGLVESCTIITCDSASNAVIAPVHHRMPVILADAEEMHAWLDPSVSAQEALTLCEPLPAGRMSARLASQAVNNVNSPEGPELLLPEVQH
jgi:putative SOS response-associated peptidase YedK